MDAAQTFRKLILFFAVALLCAGTASAALSVNTSTVSLGPSTQFTVTSSAAYSVAITSANPFFSITSDGGGQAPGGTVTILRTGSCNSGLSPCPNGNIRVTSGTETVDIAVQDVGASGGSGGGGGSVAGLSASPASLTITAPNNGYSPSFYSVTVTNTSASSQVLSISGSANWLMVSPSGTSAITLAPSTSTTLNVLGAAFGNVAGDATYTGNITITPGNSSLGSLNIPVTFVVGTGGTGGGASTGSLTVTPGSVGLTYPCSTCVQVVAVANAAGSTATSYTPVSNASWLTVTPSGSNLFLSVNTAGAASLSNGTYATTVTLVPNIGTNTSFTVTLTVGSGSGSGGTGAFASPTSLNFAYQLSKFAPLPQTVYVSGTDTYSITTTGRFFANMSTITGPGSFTVQPSVFGISAGTTSGNVVITSNTSGVSQTIAANLVVVDATAPVIAANVGSSFLGDIVCTTQSGCTIPVEITASDNSHLPITVSTSNTWIAVSSIPEQTPGTFTVQLVPTGLSGVNTGTITVSATGAANTLQIPVVLVLSGTNTGGTGSLTLNPTSVDFTAGGVKYVSIGATSGTPSFSAALGSTGCSWLQLSTSSSFTPATLTLNAVNPGMNMSCNITLTANGQSQTLPVTFTASGGGTGTSTLTPSATTVNLTAQAGSNPVPQTVQLTTTSTNAVSFTATAYVLGMSNPFITVAPPSGSATAAAPATLSISANTAGLTAGTYSGTVTVTNATASINVVLTITEPTKVSATPSTLTFNYSAGGATPAPQKITVTGVAANLPFSATVTSGADWLSVNPASGTAGTTGTDVAVSVNPTSLQANKTYTGTIVVAGTGTATGSTTITVTLVVSAPLVTVSRVTNAASFNAGSVSAGEIITIFGTAMGPQQLQVASPSNGQYPTELAGVQVTVGGYLAPLIYVRSDQISAIVPYEINRPVFVANVPVIVHYLGQGSNGFNVQQAAAAPGIFTTGGGTGQAAALNQNLSANSVNNPANKGEVIVLYLTGEGQTSPAGVTGRVTTGATTFPVSGQVTVTIDGVPAAVQYAGEAPGLVAGVMQVNAVIPNGLTHSGDLPVVVSVGGTASQVNASGVGAATINVR